MNSLQKQTHGTEPDSHENFVFTFEKNLQNMHDVFEVELLMKKLQFIGLNFDPFAEEVPSECLAAMDSLALTKHLTNPYLATNILLRLLDKTEERLNNLKQ